VNDGASRRFLVTEGLPVYVTPLRPIERVIAQLREREAATPSAPLPLT